MNLRRQPILFQPFIYCARCNKPVEVAQEFREESTVDLCYYVKCHGDYSTVRVVRGVSWSPDTQDTLWAFGNKPANVSIETPVTGKRSILLGEEI